MKAKPSCSWKALAFVAALSAAGATNAEAEMLWNWSYLNADADIKAAGTLTTKDLAENSYAITAIAGVWNGGDQRPGASSFLLLAARVEQQCVAQRRSQAG
jgi:hypothetical protein